MKVPEFLQGTTEISVQGPKIIFSFDVFGVTINFTETILIGWIIIAVLAGVFKFMTHNMEKVPTKKRQIIAEWIVNTFNSLLDDTMGARFRSFTPYVATIFIFSITQLPNKCKMHFHHKLMKKLLFQETILHKY